MGDLEQLEQLSGQHASRERFLTELTLDPPSMTSDKSAGASKDEDYVILSTIHSAKGQEWDIVYVLNVSDGNFPSEFSTGKPALIEEERRLLYVAMTRARNELHLCAPLKFAVTQQSRDGDKHVYGAKSRFMTDRVLECFEKSPCATNAESKLCAKERERPSMWSRSSKRCGERRSLSAPKESTARHPPRDNSPIRLPAARAAAIAAASTVTAAAVAAATAINLRRLLRSRRRRLRAGCPFLGFIDAQGPAAHLEAVRLLNRVLRFPRHPCPRMQNRGDARSRDR